MTEPDLPLSRPIADRAAARRSEDLLGQLIADPATRVLEICSGRAAPAPDGSLVTRAPQREDEDRLGVFLGEDDAGVSYLAVELAAQDDVQGEVRGESPENAGWVGLRALAPRLDPGQAAIAVQAVAILNWHAAHPHCPRCGSPTRVTHAGYARHCDVDGSDHWPRTDPAVIMTVVDDDDRVLLGRHMNWPAGRFSTLAGFVEPGESLESAVRREVGEEVGVQVGEVTYLASQPWPFPSSVMLGFRAQALTTALRPDGAEIAEARWFTRGELPDLVARRVVGLSSRLSISRWLLEHWYGGPLTDPPD